MTRDMVRRYKLKPGTFEDFIKPFREHIVPLRQELGFSIPEAWHDPENHEFLWVIRWEGEGSFEEADAAYYDHPKRTLLPRQFDQVDSQDVRMFERVELR
jgi:hypothetical protein